MRFVGSVWEQQLVFVFYSPLLRCADGVLKRAATRLTSLELGNSLFLTGDQSRWLRFACVPTTDIGRELLSLPRLTSPESRFPKREGRQHVNFRCGFLGTAAVVCHRRELLARNIEEKKKIRRS